VQAKPIPKGQEKQMKTSKDNFLMSAVVVAILSITAVGAFDGATESGLGAAAKIDHTFGPQAAVRPASGDVPSVVVRAPRLSRIG
jgi:ABC-type cobalt transport system substrate-binding protein